MVRDFEHCYRAVRSKDARFDGWFVTAVTSTGIYCRPSCPAVTPKRANMRFLPSAAAAQRAGFRACKRCRPDASPGSPEWNARADVVGRAMRLIARRQRRPRRRRSGSRGGSATASAICTASSSPSWAPVRSRSPAPSARRPRAC